MSTQAIKDYLVKQLFIEKNVVTYRSLSRQFGIHVNAAKEELASYHEKAPYDSQTSYATYLLTGEVLKPQRKTRKCKDADGDLAMDVVDDSQEDVGMDIFAPTQTSSNFGENDDDDMYEEEDEDYEDATTMSLTIVNENDLEDAKDKYHKVTSIHMYSLSPSFIHDASHLCTPTPIVRKTDNSKGPEHALAVGRVVAPNIHVKPIKVKATPVPAAGSSKQTVEKIDALADKATTTSKSNVKQEEEKKVAPPKKTGKLDFFNAGKVKKEEPKVADTKKLAKMFFGATTGAKVKAKPVYVKEEEEEEEEMLTQTSNRGVKRKSVASHIPSDSETESVARKTNSTSTSKVASRLPSRAPSLVVSRPPSSRAPSLMSEASSRRTSASSALAVDDDDVDSAKLSAGLKAKKRMIIPDEEGDPRNGNNNSRRVEAMKRAKVLEEKEAKDMMEMDDDAVDRVARIRRPRRRPNPLLSGAEDEDEEETYPKTIVEVEVSDADALMDVDQPPVEEEDEIAAKPKQKRKRSEKKDIPLGRNGIKKRKVTKTRHFKGECGYMQTEDYTDWESADEEEEKPKPKPKATRKIVKQEEDASPQALSRAASTASLKEKKAASSNSLAKEAKGKAAAKGSTKVGITRGKAGQGGIRSFFNVAQKS